MNQNKNIHQRLLGIMVDVDYICKGDAKVNGQYRFVSHDQVTLALRPALINHGVLAWPSVVSLTQVGNRTEITLDVEFINVDKPDDKIVTRACGYGINNADKGPGIAYSYAFKIAVLKALCIPTGEDADNDVSTKFEPPKNQEEKQQVKKSKNITSLQVTELKQMINGDTTYLKNVCDWLKNTHKIASLDDLTVDLYEQIKRNLEMKKEKTA